MFILKPKKEYHGKSLKKWYRRVYYILGDKVIPMLPKDWAMRPSVEVPPDKLSAVMDYLHKVSIYELL